MPRKIIRLKEYDYTIPNYYFVTICTEGKQKLFGKTNGKEVELNQSGIIIKESLLEIKEHFTNIEIDEYIIMPDHFHAIITFQDYVGLRSRQPPPPEREPQIDTQARINTDLVKKNTKPNELRPVIKTEHFTLSQVVAYFKYQSTKRINACKIHKEKIWQRSFYDRIIRNESELNNVRKYIQQNPSKIHSDK
ncbi:MAG: transposase [Bacteroidota bacterium]